MSLKQKIKLSKLHSKSILNNENLNIFFSIFPSGILILLIITYPVISIFYHSFTKWTISSTTFIGFGNYIRLIKDGTLLLLSRNNFILLLAVPVIIFPSLFIAHIFYEGIYGWRFFKIVFYIPFLLSSIVIGYIFRNLFALRGPLNEILKILNLDFLIVDWLSRGHTSFVIIILAFAWFLSGNAIFIFYSAMCSIDSETIEASIIDGANLWHRFRFITTPRIIGSIEFFLIILIIIFFSTSFGFIYSITSGGPGYETTTLEYMIYLKAFKGYALGMASAVAVILFVLILIMVLVTYVIFRKLEKHYGL